MQLAFKNDFMMLQKNDGPSHSPHKQLLQIILPLRNMAWDIQKLKKYHTQLVLFTESKVDYTYMS